MKHLNLSLILATSALCLLAVACGGDDDDGGAKANSNSGAGPNSGLASDRLMSSLTDAEIVQISNAVDTYTSQQMSAQLTTQQLCDQGSVMLSMLGMSGETQPTTDAELRQACASLSQQCMSDPSGTSETTTEETVTKADLTDCNATVGEYQVCMRDTTAASISWMKSFPKCADLKLDSLATTMSSIPELASPASCQTLAQKCPAYARSLDDSVTLSD
ncbi:MAG TPA: hypothetical protein VKP30_26980 [Polyangiaceae bacterium]|nr:hypothetical protein [Polyangiaceae bacterium]